MIRIASRTSPLALWQAHTIGKMLGIEYEIIEVTTTGDARTDIAISELSGTGAFATEVQNAVREGHADCAVHSAKDLPSETPEGLLLASVPLRGDVRDVLVGSTLDDLAFGAVVGTGAVRRRAQLAALRPDLQFEELRGNIDTRLRKAENMDAIVVAHAALQRLEKTDVVSEILSVDVMLPQVAQGALAVEVRSDDDVMMEHAQRINDRDAYRCVMAERSFLSVLGGGCTLPCAAYAVPVDADTMWLRAKLSEPRGRLVAYAHAHGEDPTELGRNVAHELLNERGGAEILEMVSQ